MQPSVSTSRITDTLEGPIENWTKEVVFNWLKKYFPALPTAFLGKGFTGKHLVQLATTGTSVLKDYVSDDFLRLELIDMIYKKQAGNPDSKFSKNSHLLQKQPRNVRLKRNPQRNQESR
jgi:hypothetical protein